MRAYVSLDRISDEQLEFLGYILITENELFKLYLHKGEEIIVDKSDPFIMVDDLNDAALMGSEILHV